jgi:hypothetical protein
MRLKTHFFLSSSPRALLSFMLLLSFLRCCSLFCVVIFFIVVALFFALWFFSSCCCSPLYPIVLFFTLLGFPFRIATFFFDCFPILGTRFFAFLFSSSCYFALFIVLLLSVCCYSLKNLVLPPCIPSCRNWEWPGIKNWKSIFFALLISIF